MSAGSTDCTVRLVPFIFNMLCCRRETCNWVIEARLIYWSRPWTYYAVLQQNRAVSCQDSANRLLCRVLKKTTGQRSVFKKTERTQKSSTFWIQMSTKVSRGSEERVNSINWNFFRLHIFHIIYAEICDFLLASENYSGLAGVIFGRPFIS